MHRGGDARASCASPLGTPLVPGKKILLFQSRTGRIYNFQGMRTDQGPNQIVWTKKGTTVKKK
jgi:hypothetical protein